MGAIKKIVLGLFLAAVFGMFGMASVYGLRSFLADQPLFAVVFGSGLEGSKLSLVIGTHRQWPGRNMRDHPPVWWVRPGSRWYSGKGRGSVSCISTT